MLISWKPAGEEKMMRREKKLVQRKGKKQECMWIWKSLEIKERKGSQESKLKLKSKTTTGKKPLCRARFPPPQNTATATNREQSQQQTNYTTTQQQQTTTSE
jgi:hypothetical protein